MFSYEFNHEKQDPQSKLISQIKHFGNEIFTDDNSDEFSLTLSASQSAHHFQEQEISGITNSIKMSKFTSNSKQKEKNQKHLPKEYVSPYSKRGLATSRYIQKPQKANLQQIFGQQTERVNLNPQSKEASKSNKKYKHVEARYMKNNSVMDSFEGYSTQRMKTEIIINHQTQRKKREVSAEQSEQKWKQFFSRNQTWMEKKEVKAIDLHRKNIQQQNQKLRQKPPLTERPKMTIDECIRKIKRDTIKLREKLAQNEINYYKYQRKAKSRSKSKSVHKILRVCNQQRSNVQNIESKIQFPKEKLKQINNISFSSNPNSQNTETNFKSIHQNKYISLKRPDELSFLINHSKQIKKSNSKHKK